MKKDRLVELMEFAAEGMGVTLSYLQDGSQIAEYEGKRRHINGYDFHLNSDFPIGSKLLTIQMAEHNDIPCVEGVMLPMQFEKAYQKAVQYLGQHGSFVLRGDGGFSATNTFFIRKEEDIEIPLRTLLERNVVSFMSKTRDAKIEYGVMWAGDTMPFVVRKHRNEEGFHNGSLGAFWDIETNKEKLDEIYAFSKKIVETYDCRMVRIDILDSENGLELLEISIPNVSKFSLKSKENENMAIHYFQEAFRYTFSTLR